MNKQIEEMAKHCPFYEEGNCLLLDEDALECDMNCDMCTFMEALYNADYRKQPEWISAEERLPDKNDDYLVFTKNKDIKVMPFFLERNTSAAIYGRGFCEWVRGRRTNDDDWWKPVRYVTHWVPLPMPPKGDEGK